MPDSDKSWAHDEISQLYEAAVTDPDAARRLAELYEVIDDFAKAQVAWRHAAALGDKDAIDYVREILKG